MEKPAELIPLIKSGNPRYAVRGDVRSGVVNLRMQIEIQAHPGMAISIGGAKLSADVAEIVRKALSANYLAGRDARGAALPAISASTIARRMRRVALHANRANKRGWHNMPARRRDKSRFRLRGKGPSGRKDYSYDLGDHPDRPFVESKLMAENVVVYRRRFSVVGSGGDAATFEIAWPGSGKKRGLVSDDGRGSRLFAVRHYGFDRMTGIPPQAEMGMRRTMRKRLDEMVEAAAPLRQVARQLWAVAKALETFRGAV